MKFSLSMNLPPHATPEFDEKPRPESRVEEKRKPKLRIVEKQAEATEIVDTAEKGLSQSGTYAKLMAEKAAKAGELYEQNMLRARLLKNERGTSKWDKESPYYKQWLYTTRQVSLAEYLTQRLTESEKIGAEMAELNATLALPIPETIALSSESKEAADLKFESRFDALREQQYILQDQIITLETAYLQAELLVKGCEQEKSQDLTNEDLSQAKEKKWASEEMKAFKKVQALAQELKNEEEHLATVRGNLLSNVAALFVADRRKEISTAKSRVASLESALESAQQKMVDIGLTAKLKK